MQEVKNVTAMSIKMIAKITSYEDKQLCGILDSLYFKEPFVFSGVNKMIEMMETTFDALGFPDKTFLPRTFGKAKQRIQKHEIDIEKKRLELQAGRALPETDEFLGTFEILVGFRHNAEWQGSLLWAEKDEKKKFSSIVELMKLLDEALS